MIIVRRRKKGNDIEMTMELLKNGSLKIILTEEELLEYSLTFNTLNYNNDCTKQIINQLLEMACREVGFDPESSVAVEALPIDGGCLILMTPSGGKRHVRMKRAPGPYIYELESADDILNLARAISVSTPKKRGTPGITGGLFGSSLYRFGEKYRLIIYPGTPISRAMGNLFHEFARTAGEGDSAAAYTAEHGTTIAVGDALARMCMVASTPEK